jgi:hypothetical protein
MFGVGRLLYELPLRWTDLLPFQASDVLLLFILVPLLAYPVFADTGGTGHLIYDFVLIDGDCIISGKS